MLSEKIGTITNEEKIEIQNLYERNMALSELLISLNDSKLPDEKQNYIYENALSDFKKVKIEYSAWWNEKSKKYEWKSADNANWILNFDTNEVYLD